MSYKGSRNPYDAYNFQDFTNTKSKLTGKPHNTYG